MEKSFTTLFTGDCARGRICSHLVAAAGRPEGEEEGEGGESGKENFKIKIDPGQRLWRSPQTGGHIRHQRIWF